MGLIKPTQGKITITIEDPSGFSRQVQASFEANWSSKAEREFAFEQVTWQALQNLRQNWEFMNPGGLR